MDFTDEREKYFLKKAVVTRYVKKKNTDKCNSSIVFFFQDVVTSIAMIFDSACLPRALRWTGYHLPHGALYPAVIGLFSIAAIGHERVRHRKCTNHSC